MLVKENPNAKATEAARDSQLDVDSPPAYASSSTSPSRPFPTVNLKPCNFVTVSHTHTAIKNTYILDPTLMIPEAMLTPLEDGKERKNLELESEYGVVKPDVIIPENLDYRGKVTIGMKSTYGNVEFHLHRSTPYPPVSFSGTSSYKEVRLYLPRSFQGPITATTVHGQVKCSDQIIAHQTPFSVVKGTSKFFIGDVSRYLETQGKDWEGDEVVVDAAYTHIRVSYEDELDREVRGFGDGRSRGPVCVIS